VGECSFWYRLTQVVPDKIHRAVKRLCVCTLNFYCYYLCMINLMKLPYLNVITDAHTMHKQRHAKFSGHPIQTNWCLHFHHLHHFYAGCPSCRSPPNLSWLGTGTKYAGLHTQWLDAIKMPGNQI